MTEHAWALAALKALGAKGVAGVRVEVLAKKLGVTKGSFYHHFKDRQALLEAVLQLWEHLATEQVIVQVNASSGDPRERLMQLARRTFLESGKTDAIESAIRDWAGSEVKAAKVVARVDVRRLRYVQDLLDGADIDQAALRAEIFYRALIGEFVWRRYGGPALTVAAIELLVGMCLSDRGPVVQQLEVSGA